MASPLIDTSVYESQLKEKHTKMLSKFKHYGITSCEVFRSPTKNYRMRAEFKLWHENNQCHYAMYKQGEYKKPYKIVRFEPGSSYINAAMPVLLKQLNASKTLREKCFQVEFLSSTLGELLITLIYHKPLDDQWKKEAETLQPLLNCGIIGRSKKQKIILKTDWITEKFSVSQREFFYRQVEASFTQPNAAVCESMLNWAVQKTIGSPGDLLELYCGNGNFTLPLSINFDKILATEIAKSSVQCASENISKNEIKNVRIVRMSSEEMTTALKRERKFRRLESINLDDYDFSTVFVDPPRAGLDTNTTELIARFNKIIYISCNPISLKDNIDALQTTHTLDELALFDQFPYTEHCECGAILTKRI